MFNNQANQAQQNAKLLSIKNHGERANQIIANHEQKHQERREAVAEVERSEAAAASLKVEADAILQQPGDVPALAQIRAVKLSEFEIEDTRAKAARARLSQLPPPPSLIPAAVHIRDAMSDRVHLTLLARTARIVPMLDEFGVPSGTPITLQWPNDAVHRLTLRVLEFNECIRGGENEISFGRMDEMLELANTEIQ